MRLSTKVITAITATSILAPVVLAEQVVDDFEDLSEGFYGEPYSHQGITYRDLNNVSGVFPNGDKFGPQDSDEVIVEDATLFYNDYPDWGSPDKCLTFGNAYINGDNLSLGRLSNVTMDLDRVATSISMDVAYYENGPWGGIEFHLDAVMNNQVVASDSFVLSDLGGRDSIALNVLSVSGVEFDQLELYATYGDEYSLPRIIIDDITIDYGSGGGATLSIDPDPLIGGKKATFSVTGATPNAKTFLAYSLKGTGSTFVPMLNVTLDLKSPKQAGSAKTTDGNGDTAWNLPVPDKAQGANVWLQAAQFENKTNVVTTVVQ